MATKLDEISRVIGNIESGLSSIKEAVADNREVADRRHTENRDRLDSIEETLKPLAATVAVMKPIVESYMISRWKLAGMMTLAMVLLSLLGWVISVFAGKIIALVWTPTLIGR